MNEIRALAASLNGLYRQMALAYTPIVQGIIQSGSQDVHEIEHTLDHLLSCAGHPQGLALFKSLCLLLRHRSSRRRSVRPFLPGMV